MYVREIGTPTVKGSINRCETSPLDVGKVKLYQVRFTTSLPALSGFFMDTPTEINLSIDQHVTTVTTQTLDLLFSDLKHQDALLLYFFYIKIAKAQGTNAPWATGKYCSTCLGWGNTRLFKARSMLKKLDLIEDKPLKDASGKMIKMFTKVKFVWEPTIATPKIVGSKTTIAENQTVASGRQVLDVKTEVLDDKKGILRNIPKEKENFVEEANKILLCWNDLYKTKYKTVKALINNLKYWRESYSLEDILHAIKNVQYDEYWKDKMTPVILLRRKNPRGEDVDNISIFNAIKEPEPFFTPEERKSVDEAQELLKKAGLL